MFNIGSQSIQTELKSQPRKPQPLCSRPSLVLLKLERIRVDRYTRAEKISEEFFGSCRCYSLLKIKKERSYGSDFKLGNTGSRDDA